MDLPPPLTIALQAEGQKVVVPTVRVLLIDDHLTFLGGLKRFLATLPEIEIVGEAYSGAQGIALISELNPDVIFTDLAMPDMHGLDVLRYLNRHHPKIGCIVVTGHNTVEYREASGAAGAHAFVVKSELRETLPGAIQETLSKLES